MRLRILGWSAAGLLVAVAWGIYFSVADKTIPIGPLVYTLARVTQPAAALIDYFEVPFGVRFAVIANIVTYALAGLIVEVMRQRGAESSVPRGVKQP